MVGDWGVGVSRGGEGLVGRVLKIELDCMKKINYVQFPPLLYMTFSYDSVFSVPQRMFQ
jgi:hypothetical protein